ncbi:MAG: hypothetical protein ACK5JT_12555 [Hyphomicrobiaceae bacterium]
MNRIALIAIATAFIAAPALADTARSDAGFEQFRGAVTNISSYDGTARSTSTVALGKADRADSTSTTADPYGLKHPH